MRSIFVNDSNCIEKIYTAQAMKNLVDIASLEEKVYTKADILSQSNSFDDVDFIFSTWGMPEFSEEEIKRAFPSLKAVFYAAGTVQSFARPFLSCGVKVFSSWAANAVPVAEYTVAQIILANKGFFKASTIYKGKGFNEARKEFDSYIGNYGARVGIIGAGMIGRLVIKMLKAYKIDVAVFDPFLSDDIASELGVEKVSLERIFGECNIVSNHLANNPQTEGMLNGLLFHSMLPYSTFINTGRGAQVVESELIDVLKKRPDITALLDVTYPEPIASGSEFYSLDNCIVTPHIAGSAGNEVCRMAEYMYNEFKLYLNGGKCQYEVTAKMLETMA